MKAEALGKNYIVLVPSAVLKHKPCILLHEQWESVTAYPGGDTANDSNAWLTILVAME